MLILTTAQRVHYGITKADAARLSKATSTDSHQEGFQPVAKYLSWSLTHKLHWFAICAFLRLFDRAESSN